MPSITKHTTITGQKQSYTAPLLLSKNPRSKDLRAAADKVQSMRKKVLERRPALYNILQNIGPLTMYKISENYANTVSPITTLDRKNEFIKIFSEEVAKLLGQGVAQSAARQLSEHYFVSTAEHHTPLTTPDYLNSSVHYALYASDAKNSKLENIIVLACANISFDNYASPRSLVFNSFSGNKTVLNQLPLFPRSVRANPVVYHPSYTTQSIQDAKLKIDGLLREGAIKPKQAERLYFLLDRIYARNDILNLPYFSDQITKTNYILWNTLFFFLDKYAPNLIYLEQERVVNRLLIDHHMHKNTIINNILFNPKCHELLEKYFDGISGAFNLEKRVGTYLFWALPPGQKYRQKLWREGNKLVSEDRSYEVELTPDAIQQAIINKELIPSSMLDYILLSFYYGLRLHGGINQPTSLTQMKIAYLSMLHELGDIENIKLCLDIPTTSLAMHRPSLAFLRNHEDALIPASSLDILLYGNEDSWKIMKQNAQSLTYEEMLVRNLPNLYQFVYDKNERDESLMEVTEEDIDAATGLDKKIQAFAKI
jgi:hypothetical protein